MKRTLILAIAMLASILVQANDLQTFVDTQLERYPALRLLDIYKSCFQDYMGAEHLVGDRASAEAYLAQELATVTLADMQPWYCEPCGLDSSYYRVSLRAVVEGHISAEALLDAFIASANNPRRPTVEAWRDRWHELVAQLDAMRLGLPHYADDRDFIESVLAAGRYAISHSPDYREAYHPHYRIVERTIFERDIRPRLPQVGSNPVDNTSKECNLNAN